MKFMKGFFYPPLEGVSAGRGRNCLIILSVRVILLFCLLQQNNIENGAINSHLDTILLRRITRCDNTVSSRCHTERSRSGSREQQYKLLCVI